MKCLFLRSAIITSKYIKFVKKEYSLELELLYVSGLTVHAASRHGTPSLTSLPKNDEVSCEVRPPRSPMQSCDLTRPSLTSVT